MTTRSRFALGVALWAIAATAALAFENHSPYGITYMSSPSLKEGWYETQPIRFPLKRGETVCAVYHEPAWAIGRHYLPNRSFICKHVFGLPGDRIEVTHRVVHICPQPLVAQAQVPGQKCLFAGRILTRDPSGRPVFAAALPKRIPAGYVYLGSTRVKDSFDSRYLGVFPMSDVKLEIWKI
jgi:type IV secretory pathway protease TraF